MRLLSVLLLTLPFAALANDFSDAIKESAEENAPKGSIKYEDLFMRPGVVDISGPVDVALYGGDPNDPVSYVEVRLLDEGSEDRFLFAVDPGLSFVAVTESFAGKAGGGEPKTVKVKKNSGVTADVAQIDGFRVGDVTFGEMVVLADFKRRSDVPISGVIGLAAFPELAAALLPSEGKLALYPAAQGGEALARVKGGVQLPYTIPEYAEHQLGKKIKWTTGLEGVVVPGKVGGQDVEVLLSTAAPKSYGGGNGVIAADKVGDNTPYLHDSDGRHYALPVSLGELDLGVVSLDGWDRQEFQHTGFGAIVSATSIRSLDVAVDPTARVVAVAEADKVVHASWWETAIDETLKGLEPDPESGEAPDDDAVAAVQIELSAIYGRLNDDAKEVESAKKAVELSGDDCSTHYELGHVLFKEGRYEEAKPHLRAAGEMWSDWDAFSLEERKQFQEDKAEAEEDELDWTGPIPQSPSCDAAWADLAEAELATGNYDAAITLFDTHGELNAALAIAAGNAWLAKGNASNAEAAYRQAVLLVDSFYAQSGIAITKAQQGLNEQAAALIEKRVDASYRVPAAARVWLQVLSQQGGPEAALAAAKAHAESYPHDPFAQLAYAEAQVAAGQDASATLDATIARFERELRTYDDDNKLWAGYATALMHAGRAAEAKAAAERAIVHYARQPDAYLVLSQLAAADGDEAAASKLHDQAKQSATSDPAAWWLLSTR
ncbi:MAG: hypothetical protein H6741_20715 [Alphaproteobacteria bacterium]|nr:hypothetical protein [Alphaproteobacteria bacterium]MCB9795132.1 hypothetical protein [Alphaproteobacteria bacterium]